MLNQPLRVASDDGIADVLDLEERRPRHQYAVTDSGEQGNQFLNQGQSSTEQGEQFLIEQRKRETMTRRKAFQAPGIRASQRKNVATACSDLAIRIRFIRCIECEQDHPSRIA